ncbi:MAG: hypothetical protein OIF51_09745 [Cellvibrionaceae bacterium]|nr:hypothetical protein [Cellvibrionaceae bacterium]
MKTLTRYCSLSLLILLMSGCVSYKLINAGEVNIQGISFSTQEAWSQSPHNIGKYTTLMTRDGMGLNQLILVHGVPYGQAMFDSPNKDIPVPPFSQGLMPHELENLVKSSLINTNGGTLKISTDNLRPMQLDSGTGVAFDLEYFNQSGLLIKGKSIAAIKNDQLYVMILTAAKLEYYESYKEDFSAMVNSFRI